jgi:hypothetical protein
MVLGLSGIAVVCWDLASVARWRPIALLGLPLCLAGATATHLYAILMIVPLAMGELARTWERRRVDWLVWVGLLPALLMFVPGNPIIAKIRGLTEVACPLTLSSRKGEACWRCSPSMPSCWLRPCG